MHMMIITRQNIIISLLFISISNFACLDSIELAVPGDRQGRLVIEGSVLKANFFHVRVAVSRTFRNQDVILLPDESPIINLRIDGTNALSLKNNVEERISVDDFYELYGAASNSLFSVEVIMPDGTKYSSSGERIIPNPEPVKLEVDHILRPELNSEKNIVNQEYVELFASGQLNNQNDEKVSLRWDVTSAFEYREIPCSEGPFQSRSCYVSLLNHRNEINVLLANRTEQMEVSRLKIAQERADHRFFYRYYFNVVQRSLSDRAAIYWDQIAAGISREGTIFDVPSGKVEGNIKNEDNPEEEVLGYFYVSDIDTIRYRVAPSESGYQGHQCRSFELTRPSFCCNCAATYGAETLRKPSYWGE